MHALASLGKLAECNVLPLRSRCGGLVVTCVVKCDDEHVAGGELRQSNGSVFRAFGMAG